MPAYRIAPAPRFAGMRDWDCSRCGRTEVKPVFLTDGTATAAYGSGCAARMLGRPETAARKVRDEAAAIQRQADAEAAAIQERKDAATRALAAFQAREETPDVDRFRRNYNLARRFGRLDEGLLFPAYMARAAETGEV